MVPGGSMSDMIPVFHQSFAINAKGGRLSIKVCCH
jgi:hypothetical protein